MSTKVQLALDALAEALGDGHEIVSEAQAEWSTVTGAATTLDRLNVGDFTYNIRDRAAGDASFTGNTWEHPDVKAWSDASVVINNIAKESK